MSYAQKKSVILILSHLFDKNIGSFFKEIKQQIGNKHDIFFLCDNSNNVFDAHSRNNDYFLFTVDDLNALGYPGKSSISYSESARRRNPNHKNFNFIPGSTDLPPLHFYRHHPDYDYYWTIEYDVRFSGHWSRFFASFDDNDADLLATTLTRHEAIPNWYHWPSLDVKDDSIDPSQYLRGFFPIYRLSRRACAQIDLGYRRGDAGHYECLLPTLLLKAGMKLEDIGGDGEFVRPNNIDRFYRNTPTAGSLAPGTFVFRPALQRAGTEPNKLWHPVKPSPWWLRIFRKIGKVMTGTIGRLANKDNFGV